MANRVDVLVNTTKTGTGAKETVSDLEKVNEAAGLLSKGIGGLAVGAGVAGLLALGQAAVGTVTDLARSAAGVTDMRVAFDGLARQAGESGNAMLSAMKQASAGMVSNADLVAAANRAMLLGVADSGAELAQLLDVARVRGQAMGLSLTDAFSDVVTGIGRMSPLILDNLGIVTGGEKVFDDYAASLGRTAASLTDAEKKQALLNKVIADTQPLINSTVAAGQDMMAPFERFDAALANAKQSLGELFGPAVAAAAEAVADALQSAVDVVEENAQIDAKRGLFVIGDELTKAAAEYQKAVEAFTDASVASDTEGMRAASTGMEMLRGHLQALAQEYNAAANVTGAPLIDLNQLQLGEIAFVSAADGAKELAEAFITVDRGSISMSDHLREALVVTTELGVRGAGVLSDHLRDGAAATRELNVALANSPAAFGMFAAAALAAGVPVEQLIDLIDDAAGALNQLQGARDSAVRGLASNLARQVEDGLISREQATALFDQGVDKAESAMQQMTQTMADAGKTTDDLILEQELLFQTVDDGSQAIDEADAAAKKYARTLESDAKKAANEAARAFEDLKGRVAGVLSGSLDTGVRGGEFDKEFEKLLPREDAINEDARRLADVAIKGYDSPWAAYLNDKFPALFGAAFQNPDVDIRQVAARLLNAFESGFVPELIDKEKAKERVRGMILGEQRMDALAQEIAEELAAEMGTTIPDTLRKAQEALGVGGAATGALGTPAIDTAASEESAATAAAAFGSSLLSGIADAGTKAITNLSAILRNEDNLKLMGEAGARHGMRWGDDFLKAVSENVPQALIDLLVNLVTPGVGAAQRQQQSLTGASG